MERIIAKIEKHIQQTGVKMVEQGWKMALDESCKLCGGYLLTKVGEYLCLECNNKKDVSENEKGGETAHGVEITSSVGDLDSEWSVNLDNMPATFEELMKEYEQKNSSRDVISSRLGEKLLQGWAMLEDYCPATECIGVPLVTDSKLGNGEGQLTCVCCGSVYCRTQGGGLNLINSQQNAEYINSYDAAKGFDISQVPDLSIYNDDDSTLESNLISKALLIGGSLLADICPNSSCSTPLVRDKQGVIKCVACGALPTESYISSTSLRLMNSNNNKNQLPPRDLMSEIKDAVKNEYSDTDDSADDSNFGDSDSMDSSKLFAKTKKSLITKGKLSNLDIDNSDNRNSKSSKSSDGRSSRKYNPDKNQLQKSVSSGSSSSSSVNSFSAFLEKKIQEKKRAKSRYKSSSAFDQNRYRKSSPVPFGEVREELLDRLEMKISETVETLGEENSSFNDTIVAVKLIKSLTEALHSARHMND